MVKKADVPKAALSAALEQAAATGWRGLTMRDIAEASGATLAQLHEAYPSKGAILDAFIAEIDAKVLSGTGADMAGEAAKDRLFDVLMRRFDALAEHRDAVRSIVRDSAGDVGAATGGFCRLLRSMRWMLEAAGIGTSGLGGRLRVKGLALLYSDVMRTWLSDDSEDMARTMAALDKRLGQADRTMARLCRLAPKPRRRDEDLAEAGA